MKLSRLGLAVASVVCAVWSSVASPGYKADVVVAADAVASGVSLKDFPVLVKVSPETISGFSYEDCASDGSDLSFADAEGNPLAFEIDTWNPSGVSYVWVKLPSLAAGTTFTMYWRDDAPEAHVPSATWKATYGGVWHMGEASGTCANSTSLGTAYDAVPQGNTANSIRYAGTDAPVGGARQTATSAAKGYLSVPNYDTLGYGGTFTVSAWVRLTGCTGYPRLFSRKSSYTDANGWEIEMTSGSYVNFSARGSNNPSYAGTFASPGLKQTWVHVVMVYDGTNLKVYGDGKLVKDGTINTATDNGKPLSFGCNSNGSETYVQGAFDECRLMGGAASAEWVKADYDTVKNAAFLTYGAAEEIRTDPSLRISKPFVKTLACNSVTLQVSVGGLGEGATSASCKVVYGASAETLDTEATLVDAITAKGRYVGTVKRLYPNTVYYMKAVVTNDKGETAESEVFRLETPTVDDGMVRAGLWQTFFTSANAKWDKDVTAIPEDPNNLWKNYTDANRTKRRELMPIAAYEGGNPGVTKRVSALWGDEVYWPVNGGQWVYWGRIYLDATKTYKFRMKIDDNERITITDAGTKKTTVLLNDTANGSAVITSADYTPSMTGWHEIEIRMSDGNGGLGGYDTSNGYLNSNNLGWSQDGGATWDILQDTGDASTLSVTGGTSIDAAEKVSAGVLSAVELTFDAAAKARDLYVVYGPEHKGIVASAWAHAEKVATVAAGATGCTYAAPATWGTDDNLVMRFYFDTTPAEWSNSVFWRDFSAPAVDGVTLNGRGGDTLVVSGTVPPFVGATCTLKVLVGASAEELTDEWSGLPGSTLTQAGDFALTLYDLWGGEKCLKAGETYYVCVEAKANGKVARSVVQSVTMSKAAVFKESASSVARRTVTFTGSLSDLGMADTSDVTLWVGDSSDATKLVQSGEPLTVTNAATFSFAHTFADFEAIHYWQFRAANTSHGGNETAEARTAVAKCQTLDTTTYTWKGGAEGDFADATNWSDDKGGDALGYPQSAAATAVVPEGTKVRLVLTKPLTVGTLNLSAANVDVTFAQGGAGTNETKLTVNTFNVNGAGGRIVLDNVALWTGASTLGARREVILTNAANWYANGDAWFENASSLKLYGDSYFSANQIGFGGGDSVISDSTVWSRSNDFFGRNQKGGSMTFRGTHPIWWHNHTGCSFYSPLAGANFQLNFEVPVGGYAVAPIRAATTPSYCFGNNGNNAGACALTVNVLDSSPANRVSATVTTPLIAWPKGINKSMLLEGTLPTDDGLADDSFVWSGEEKPLSLSVQIVGSSHADSLRVSGAPEDIPGVSPACGYTALAAGAKLTCTAPDELVQLSETKRATCTGWKLYAVDSATHVRTLRREGKGVSCEVTGDGSSLELEWQWKVEYLVTVTSAGHGTAAAKSAWVETGKKAYITVTPDTGYGFYKWTGDIAADRDKTTDLFITVRDRAYALTANFLPAVSVSTTDGELADQVAKNTGKVILLPDEIYFVTKQIVVGAGTIVRGDRAKGDEPVVKLTTKLSSDTTSPSSIFKLADADAALEGIAITTAWPLKNDKNDTDYARGVWLEGAGLVDNCVITNCRSIYVSNKGGGGVYLNGGGIVRNTKIIDCRTYASGGNNAQGHAAFLEKGGLLETCEIRGCGLSSVPSSSTAVLVTGGTVRNCLIADCSQGHNSGDWQRGVGMLVNAGASCVIENCTIAGNYMMSATSMCGFSLYNGSASSVLFRNNIVWDNRNSMGVLNWWFRSGNTCTSQNNCTTPVLSGTDEIDADPTFTDAANGDYTIGYSPSVDSALYLDWMDDVLDLAGNERCIGAAPDRGCYEFKPNGLVCGFSVAQEGSLETGKLTLAASVLGDTAGIVYTWTLVDQDGKAVVTNGADLATVVLNAGVGRYSVTLTVENGAGETGSAAKANCAEVCPSHVYVSTSGTSVYPYASYETGATSIADALLAATDGTTIHVADGSYFEDDTLKVVKAVRIVSENGPAVTKVFAYARNDGNPMVLVGNAGATLSGLTLSGLGKDGKSQLQWSGLRVLSDGGTVTNCWICDNSTVSISVSGAGARLEGGTVVDCLFSNNWTKCSGGGGMRAGAIYVTGANALVDRCRILNNKVSDGGVSYGGGVYLTAGLVRNCLIDGNFAQNIGGGAAVEGSGVLQNCTVVRNSVKSSNGGIWQNGNGQVIDCLAWNNDVNGAPEDVDDPGFVDAPNGNFHLTSASPAVDAGTAANPGAYDLELAPRISGKKADKGCFEYDQNQFSVGITYEKLTPFAPGAVTFRAVATPATVELDAAQTWWTFDGSEPTADNHDAEGLVVERTCEPGYVTVRFRTVYKGADYAIDRPDWFACYGDRVYVRKDAENPVFPYATPETATADYAAGMGALQENATIIFGEGTWKLPMTYTLSKACTVVGAGPDKTVIDHNTGDRSTPRAFELSHPGATVSGFTFKNAKSWNPGGSITMSAGVVTNCCFVDNRGLNAAQGTAVYMTGGLIVDCVMEGCGPGYHNSAELNQGSVLVVYGTAVADRCIIRNSRNFCTDAEHYARGHGAVLLSEWGGVSGTIRNSLVTGSRLDGCGGIVAYGKATIENCTIADNQATNCPWAAGLAISNKSVKVVNTLVTGNRSVGETYDVGGVDGYENCLDTCLVGVDAKFRRRGSRPYQPGSTSACIDAARPLSWMDGAKDVYGQPRVSGRNPDIGASEGTSGGFFLKVR